MNTILSQAKTPDGILTPHANTPVGFSTYLMHARGSQVTLLAEIMDLTPLEVNERLKEVEGFQADADGQLCEVNFTKLPVAFPNWSAKYIQPYDNDLVLKALASEEFVIVQTYDEKGNPHSVRYVGSGLCHDPKDGTIKPTITYPAVFACVILTKLPQSEEVITTQNITEETDAQILEPQSSLPVTGVDKDILKQLKKINSATRTLKKLLQV